MTEEQTFVAAIGAEPTNWLNHLVYADWLAERDRPEEQAWRWIAAFKRCPCPFVLRRLEREPYWAATGIRYMRETETLAGYGWGRWDFKELKWPDSAGFSMLPADLFRRLPKGHSYLTWNYSERMYDSVALALHALVQTFVEAVKPRVNWIHRQWAGKQWLPDWDTVASVPED